MCNLIFGYMFSDERKIHKKSHFFTTLLKIEQLKSALSISLMDVKLKNSFVIVSIRERVRGKWEKEKPYAKCGLLRGGVKMSYF